jgi:hypothetical protein
MKRLSLLELHKAEIKRNVLGKIKGGIEVKCVCSINNPVVGTRESGGPSVLCLCDGTYTVSNSTMNRPNK